VIPAHLLSSVVICSQQQLLRTTLIMLHLATHTNHVPVFSSPAFSVTPLFPIWFGTDCDCLSCQVRCNRTGVEPEWLMGKIGSHEGLFPETFVQLATDETVPPLYANASVRFV